MVSDVSLPLRGRVVGAPRQPGGEGQATHPHISQNLVHPVPDIAIGDPHHNKAFAAQNRIPNPVLASAVRIKMRPSVHLDDQTSIQADEVQNVASLRVLATKMQTLPPKPPQMDPEARL